ncbi:MAG: hypothetical protein M0019_05100 [Actinomycetota bacterium]|nr:hypothetical protein [Actinomycetota bacterium]
MEWSFKGDEDDAFNKFFAPKPASKWESDDEAGAVEESSVKNEYEGFEAALLKIAALDPIDEETSAPTAPTHFVFDSFGAIESSEEPFDDEEDIIDIPFNPDPNFSYETFNFAKSEAAKAAEVFDYDEFEEDTPEVTTPVATAADVEVNFDAERRFMGARGNESLLGGAPKMRRDEYGISKELFETLRKTALLASSPKEVRESYFTVAESASDKPNVVPSGDVTDDLASKPIESSDSDDIDIMQLRPVLRNSVGVIERQVTAPTETAAIQVVTDAQVESIVERARKTKIDPVADEPNLGDDDGSFFKDLSAKNNIFGTTMEIDSKKLQKQEKTNAKWERGDDDIFVAKDEKHHHRRSKKSSKNDDSDPVTMEIIMDEGKKKSRLMEILTKKL